jgi:EpsI family protein
VIELPTSPYKIQTNQLFVEQKNIRQLSYYWFKVGTTFTPNYWKQQFLIAFSTLTGQHASSALIRISTLKKENESGSEETLNQFTKLITPLLFQYLP